MRDYFIQNYTISALIKAEVSPTKNGPDSPDIANVILKQRDRDDVKRSESPAVSKPVIRRDSSSAEKIRKLNQPLKFVDENHIFCDGISDFLSDNTDFVVIGVFGLQNAGKSTILNCLAKLSPDDEDVFRVQNFEHQMLGMSSPMVCTFLTYLQYRRALHKWNRHLH